MIAFNIKPTLRDHTPISKELPMNNLGLGYLLKQGHKKRAETKIQEAIDTAIKMELLLGFEEDELGLFYIFELNPERCLRLRLPEPEDGEKRAS